MGAKWLEWAKRMQSISQAGIEYSSDPFDKERFEQLRLISIEILAEYSGLKMEKVADLFANETGYQTPKVDVRASVLRHEKILLVQENDGKWALPGGWAEPHMSLRENITKEVKEEAGVYVIPDSIIAILDRNLHAKDIYPYSVYKIFVSCTYLSGCFQENIETSTAAFFSESNLPEISESRNSKKQIEMCFQFSQEDNPRVAFD